jgi:hypothetical protein
VHTQRNDEHFNSFIYDEHLRQYHLFDGQHNLLYNYDYYQLNSEFHFSHNIVGIQHDSECHGEFNNQHFPDRFRFYFVNG